MNPFPQGCGHCLHAAFPGPPMAAWEKITWNHGEEPDNVLVLLPKCRLHLEERVCAMN